MPKTVVITGASAGIGRATARAYAARGANVILLARGRAGLATTADDVERAGGHALALPTDMADHQQVEAAAEAAVQTFGGIDVWINAAFASVFAPFTEITAEEYARVTEVTYLGFVNGTRAALTRMLPHNRGTIVQIGSALGSRSVPLQSAYCGAKHGINGFTSSVRTELMHSGSNVRITIAQMPAVNTPQFSWVLSRLPGSPRPVAPIYQPEVAAQAVLYAADHPGRKQFYVGASTAATILANKIAPGLLDRYLARTGYDSQQTDQPDNPQRRHNLWAPADDEEDYGAHGDFDDQSSARAPQLWLAHHPALAAALLAGAALGSTWAASRLAGQRTH
ncbi:SDR family oxidoreductase [Streptomyces sp900116325]|uniref:SDR family oxidoreductase n=1 Tax=Streptomyces sp. 900116325 TaxID=3154295 RepID=A0ABV2UM25_9ACTN